MPATTPPTTPPATRTLRGREVPVHIGEFWTAKQRDGHSLHEISYRACYKSQLPNYFIERYSRPGDTVYDPFMGRGTTLIEARLLDRVPCGNDVNPLARVLTAPRLQPPTHDAARERIEETGLPTPADPDPDLLTFFEERTLNEIYGWRDYFKARKAAGTFDRIDAWLQMVACNRLTGHSPGFFSVYTLPPNQATSVTAQRRINAKRNQQPEYRATRERMVRKSKSLLRHPLPPDYPMAEDPVLLAESADATPAIPSGSVDLVVTSPPFLNTVDYITDNWMRMWFCGVELEKKRLWQIASLDGWLEKMTAVFRELHRVLRPGGRIAFEVGEVRKQTIDLANEIVGAALDAGLEAEAIYLHVQEFTKTANCWGVDNNSKGTNTNRIVVLRKT